MKRFLLCMPLLLMLCGCSARREEQLLADFSDALARRRDLQAVALIQARYEQGSLCFRLAYEEQDGEALLTVLAPEELEGLTVALGPSGAVLQPDSLHLETGALDRQGLSPLNALPLLAESLRQPCARSFRQENGLLVVRLQPEDERELDVYFEAETMTPRRAEFFSRGQRCLLLELESWN